MAVSFSARVHGSTATAATTGLATATSGPIIIAGSMEVGDSVLRPRFRGNVGGGFRGGNQFHSGGGFRGGVSRGGGRR